MDEAEEPSATSDLETPDEETQADEQWLRRIPDDPGGLLRRKFKYQYQNQARRQAADGKAW
jgi:Ca-activated chloride channel family protein